MSIDLVPQHSNSLDKLERKDSVNVTQLFMDHKSKNAHHGGAALVQFDSVLTCLLLIRERIPTEVDEVVTEVTGGFSTHPVSHEGCFQKSDEEKDLQKSFFRDRGQRGKSTWDVRKFGSREVNVSRQTVSADSGDVTSESKLGDTSVLEFDETESLEPSLISVLEQIKRVVESEGFHGTNLVFERHVGGDRTGRLLGRSEGSRRSDDGGDDDRLHGVDVFDF
jgi:hypothetical protein